MARATRPGRRALLGLALAAGACGFTPVYAPGGSGARLDRGVEIVAPDTSDGFTLRQQLQDRLGPATRPEYRLTVTIATRPDRVAVTREQDTNRYNIIGRADFVLTRLDGVAVTSGTAERFNSYAATGSTVATLASERDAYRRLMVILADGITDQLLVSLAGAPA